MKYMAYERGTPRILFCDLEIAILALCGIIVTRSTMQLLSRKTAALETTQTLYPEQDQLHTYTDCLLTDRNENAGERIHCKLFSFYLSLGKHTTCFRGEIEATNTALRQLFSRTGSYKMAVILSDSTAALLSAAKFDMLPVKRITEIHSQFTTADCTIW
jgi:hypothetical protein